LRCTKFSAAAAGRRFRDPRWLSAWLNLLRVFKLSQARRQALIIRLAALLN
jgi:hypothetical protein